MDERKQNRLVLVSKVVSPFASLVFVLSYFSPFVLIRLFDSAPGTQKNGYQLIFGGGGSSVLLCSWVLGLTSVVCSCLAFALFLFKVRNRNLLFVIHLISFLLCATAGALVFVGVGTLVDKTVSMMLGAVMCGISAFLASAISMLSAVLSCR